MRRSGKETYTEKQKRQAQHIEASYREEGVSEGLAEKIAWATVNKQSGGGEKSGSGKNTPKTKKQAAKRDSAKNAVKTKKDKQKPNALENKTLNELRQLARDKNITGRSSMNKADLIQTLRRQDLH